jgi:HK97 family phage prohead protease
MKDYDFSGWATRNNIECSDGRTIMKDAFLENDGQKVPLVWNHQHDDPDVVLGHALLENREDGVYAYCKFNNTEAGLNAKELVKNGDITNLSIYANKLKSQNNQVYHGCIREVSLVLAGANPGAFIDSVIAHSDDPDAYDEEEGVIYTDESIVQAEDNDDSENNGGNVDMNNEEENKSVESSENTEVKTEENTEIAHADDEKTVGDVFNTLTDEQKEVVYAMIGQAIEDTKKENKEGEGDNMKHNVFDQDNENKEETLMHSEIIADAIKDAKRVGSMKESFIEHAAANNIEHIEYLFPEAKELNNPPKWVERQNDDWVARFMAAVTHSPFSRVKTTFADMTAEQARAKGYIKGKIKTETAMTLLKRSTTPTTVYVKAKIDRDDVVDITDFNVVAWQKAKMRTILDRELAVAMLLGDGRSAADDDKINEQNIRPVLTDDANLFVINYEVTDGRDYDSSKENDSLAKGIIRAAIKARKSYRGSGRPTLFTTEEQLTDMLLLEDLNGHRLYKNEDELATALRVSKIETVPELETRAGVYGIILNPKDYTAGADKGGSVNMFDDFDIDYNQMKYLMETRMSGALTEPFSAIILKAENTGNTGNTENAG